MAIKTMLQVGLLNWFVTDAGQSAKAITSKESAYLLLNSYCAQIFKKMQTLITHSNDPLKYGSLR
jgi:hypothetical protein